MTLPEGDWISDTQVQGNANVVVLGASLAQTLFGTGDPVGQTIRVNTGGGGGGRSAELLVIGVGEFKGGTGFDNPDTEIYAPLTTVMEKLSRPRSGTGVQAVSQLAVKAIDGKHIASLEQEITTLLMQQHHLSSAAAADFSLTSQQD